MKMKLIIVSLLILILVASLFGQTQPSLEEILGKAEIETVNYQNTFRNLLAVETKTFIDFDKNGIEKKRNTVDADFLVYQSSKNNKISFELRNVKMVDNKPIPNNDANSDIFFAELSKTSTLKSELDKIEKKSSKYDKTLDISGLTLYEGIILSQNLRPFFDFQVSDLEKVQDKDVYIISYQQTKPSPFIIINGKETDLNAPSLNFNIDIPGELRKNNFFLRGRFTLDATTFQILREERELLVQATEPIVLISTKLVYQPSDYGILVPKQITLTTNLAKKKDGKYITVKDLMIIFDYSKFRKTETDVKILDDTES